MDTSVQEALKIGLVNDQIHSVVISGGTGVGKSFAVRHCKRLSTLKRLCNKVRW